MLEIENDCGKQGIYRQMMLAGKIGTVISSYLTPYALYNNEIVSSISRNMAAG